jgi:hypothetical protein
MDLYLSVSGTLGWAGALVYLNAKRLDPETLHATLAFAQTQSRPESCPERNERDGKASRGVAVPIDFVGLLRRMIANRPLKNKNKYLK